MKGYQGLVLGCLLLPVTAMAQVPVMEGSGGNASGYQTQAPSLPDTRSSSAGLSVEGQLMQQLYQMQQEVSMLRGLLEEQEHRLKKLEKDQLDRYQDIDRRLSSISAGSPAPSGSSASANGNTLPPVTPRSEERRVGKAGRDRW